MTTALWLAIVASIIGAGGLAHVWRVERVEREALDEGMRLGRALADVSPETARSLSREALAFAEWSRARRLRPDEHGPRQRGRW